MSFSNPLENVNEKEIDGADITIVLCHAKYGEMKACTELAMTGVGHHPTLVWAKKGK